jgi:7-keto-8-aminopelargonate synthetase-like enzyme
VGPTELPGGPGLREALGLPRERTRRTLPTAMTARGFELAPGRQPIVAVRGGAELEAARLAGRLAEPAVHAVGLGFPVVRWGTAPILGPISAANSRDVLDLALVRPVPPRAGLGGGGGASS